MGKIEIGRWGNVAILILSDEGFQLISSVEIQEDQYGHPLFPNEINKFMKVRKVSFFQNGKWVFIIREREQLEEIVRKLTKRGIPFQPNPHLKEIFTSSEARDITSVVYSIVPISP